jgi:hypothetical protein
MHAYENVVSCLNIDHLWVRTSKQTIGSQGIDKSNSYLIARLF